MYTKVDISGNIRRWTLLLAGTAFLILVVLVGRGMVLNTSLDRARHAAVPVSGPSAGSPVDVYLAPAPVTIAAPTSRGVRQSARAHLLVSSSSDAVDDFSRSALVISRAASDGRPRKDAILLPLIL